MPHVDLKVKGSRLSPADAACLLAPVAQTVGEVFDMDPDYVSVEVVEQGSALNRKDIDIEVSSDPSADRIERAGDLAERLRDLALETFADVPDLEVSAWVRIFDSGTYEYGSGSQ